MTSKPFWMLAVITLAVWTMTCTPAWANDTAASTAAGGIQPVKEPRVSMQKERLFISAEKVRVEYEFLNTTDQDITTEVAFPIPEFGFGYDSRPSSFDDFAVWVDGQKVKYQTEVKALVHGKDIAPLLRQSGIDVKSFGHFDWSKNEPLDFLRLPPTLRQDLLQAAVFDSGWGHFAQWTVAKTYHWTQTFRAHSVLHVAHEYTPVAGFAYLEGKDLNLEQTTKNRQLGFAYLSEQDARLDSACVDASFRTGLASAAKRPKGSAAERNYGTAIQMVWIDYILTTANSWKSPIADFELVVERSDPLPGGKSLVSFCWDGPVRKLDNRHFVAHTRDFIPKRELRVAFFE